MKDDDPLADAFNEGLGQRPPKPPSDLAAWLVWGIAAAGVVWLVAGYWM